MNFREIIEFTDRYNFHTHTQFCDGRASIEEMAQAAADAGFVHIGFSPHSPINIPSPCNMSLESVSQYSTEIERVRKLHEGKCLFYKGMEIDYLSPEYGPSSQIFSDFNLDYSIGSVHFIRDIKGEFVDVDGHFDSFRKKMEEYFHNDIRYVVSQFYEASNEMLNRGCFDILGHFDKIAQNASYYSPGIEDEGWYQDIVDDYITHIIESGVIVEINTKAYVEHGRFFPNPRYWKRLADAGVTLVVNSDAHYPDRIDASRAEAFAILKTEI
ncbi:MAG: histidinol-phosphatase [Muribaculaceae bacterium]